MDEKTDNYLIKNLFLLSRTFKSISNDAILFIISLTYIKQSFIDPNHLIRSQINDELFICQMTIDDHLITNYFRTLEIFSRNSINVMSFLVSLSNNNISSFIILAQDKTP